MFGKMVCSSAALVICEPQSTYRNDNAVEPMFSKYDQKTEIWQNLARILHKQI
jgi:hypothetical protein